MRLIVNSYRIFLLLGLFALPFIYWPTAYVPYEIPKVWFTYFWIEILASLTLLAVLKGRKTPSFGILLRLTVIYLITLTVSSFFGIDIKKSFFGNYFRLDGLVTIFHLFVFSLTLSVFSSRKLLKEIAVVTLISSFLVALTRIGFGQPVFLGGYLGVTIPAYLYLFSEVKPKLKLLILLAIGINIWVIWVTNTVGALIAVTLGVLFWWMLRYQKKLLLLALGVFAIIGGLAIFFYLAKPFAQPFVPENRQRIIIKTFLGFITERRILTGFGVANVDYAFDAGVWPIEVKGDVYLDKAHSTVLETLITAGPVGLTLYIFVLIFLFSALYKKSGLKIYRFLMTTFLVYLFHSQTNVLSIAEEIYFWIVLGVGFSLENGDR